MHQSRSNILINRTGSIVARKKKNALDNLKKYVWGLLPGDFFKAKLTNEKGCFLCFHFSIWRVFPWCNIGNMIDADSWCWLVQWKRGSLVSFLVYDNIKVLLNCLTNCIRNDVQVSKNLKKACKTVLPSCKTWNTLMNRFQKGVHSTGVCKGFQQVRLFKKTEPLSIIWTQ